MKHMSRTGSMYVELLAAILVVSVIITVSAQLISLIVSRMAHDQQRQVAIETASNLLEIITAQPFDEINDQSAQHPAIEQLMADELSGWTLDVRVTLDEQPLRAKRIELVLDQLRDEANAVRLTAWKH